ncbi:MAG: tRNA (adenosine(37)-N6)-threonylcarbamoyltransferase complex ATPase subunit type 1 TsaE [Lachnospiraceae bacterium]|nr:tRNA (adenosine(37)-N6)-threonylcarbamoyltransferase complex ATPase subunit type 1 TsaE [Lachnospiraceae bacterium]
MNIAETHSQEETRALARKIGERADAGTVIGLTGDLGCGKTVFAKGIAEGVGVKEHVSSPTYTIMQQYDDGRMPVYHFDVYRIGDVSEMDETGYEDCFFGEGISIVEWADMVREIMPEDTIWVSISRDLSKGEDYRRIVIEDEV